MDRLIKGEKGRAMVLVLTLLLMGGLTTTPLLAYMGTGILAGEGYEAETSELYAADARFEDAVWKMHHQDEVEGAWPCNPSSPPLVYNITDINGKSVDVEIAYVEIEEDIYYRITSTATDDSNSHTTIESKEGSFTFVPKTDWDFPGELPGSFDVKTYNVIELA